MSRRPSDGGSSVPAVAVRAHPVRLGAEYGLGDYQRAQLDKARTLSFRVGVIVLIVAAATAPTAVIPL